MTYKHAVVTLAAPTGKTFDLRYEILPQEAGNIWADCVRRSLPGGLKETDRFYNFSKNSTLEDLASRFETVKAKLEKLHPDIEFPLLDKLHLADSVNRLHRNFVHSHFVESKINTANEKLWTEFNEVLHAIESHIYNLKFQTAAGIPHARIIFTCNDQAAVKIPEHLLQKFSLGWNFGYAYFNYCQVGRQLFEIFLAQDADVLPGHIQPPGYFSADTLLWFGGDFGENAAEKLLPLLKEWFRKNGLLEKLPYEWGDPRLAIGQVAVARLVDMPGTTPEKLALIEKLAQYRTVAGIALE